MTRLLLIAYSFIIFATCAYAGPSQLDVVGLVPGVSTQEQVEKAKADYGYLIGGYELFCTPEYLDGILSKFVCLTGKKSYSHDRTNNIGELASNTEIHTVLSEGFQKKFGTPSKIENFPLSNNFGMKANSNVLTWVDNKGNNLILMSIAGNADQGAMIFQSSKSVEKKEAERKKAEQKRKF